MVSFGSVPNGVNVYVPGVVALTNTIGTPVGATGSEHLPYTGIAVLTSTNAAGGGAFSAVSGGLVQVSVFGGSATAVYEVVLDDPFNTEQMVLPVTVAYASDTGNNLPAPEVQSTVLGSFAPLSTVGVMSATAPIPRFVPSGTAANSFIIHKCTCNLLFPFVTNQAGFDTGIAIANTSQDPFGTSPQEGTITLNYYSAGTPPSAQTTDAVVPAGDTLDLYAVQWWQLWNPGYSGLPGLHDCSGSVPVVPWVRLHHRCWRPAHRPGISRVWCSMVVRNINRNVPAAESLGQ